ncbi:MAG TPA: phage portal protein [Chitinophagaceae bacterium]|nr:phage portal protein [Chitinophagaceae bacterium]
MSRITKAWKALTGPTGPVRQGSGNLPTGFRPLVGLNGQLIWNTDNDQRIVKNGYLANDIVYSIISLITNKTKVAPWGVYKIEDESSLKSYEAALKHGRYKEAREFKHKALELYTGDGKLNELLKYPNEQETWSDLIEQACGFKLLTGDKYIYADLLQAGANTGKPNSLTVLPSQLMQIYSSNTFPARPVGYRISYGYIVQLSTEQILHERYWNPQWDSLGSQLYGLSPLKAACKNIDRSNAAKETSTRKFKNGGAEGIAYFDDDAMRDDADLAEEQIGATKKHWEDEYAGSTNAGKIVFSGYKMGYENFGLSPVDLAIIEAEKWDMRMLCNIFGVPSQLMNDPDKSTMNNVKEAERALTGRCALPQLIDTRSSINRKLYTDWGYKRQNIYIDFDTSVYPELQESQVDRAAWMSKGPLTVRQWYEMREIEIPEGVADEVLDMMLIPSNLRDAESMGLAVPDISNSVDSLDKMKLL